MFSFKSSLIPNTYKIKACSVKLFTPETNEEIREIREANSNIWILGAGSNIILSKKHYNNICFIIISENFSKITFEGKKVNVQSGAKLKEIVEAGMERDLGGMEIFYDIPGTLGGAIVMNAGACGESISDFIVDVTFIEKTTGKIVKVAKEELRWGYRKSDFQNNDKIILGATLELEKKPKEEIKERIEKIVQDRHSKQPWELPNAGSVFKRPEGYYVGKMIEELGLKGFQVGGMKISEKHAGFIVNIGEGTGEDVLGIVKHVRSKVKERYGVELELEQVVI